MFKSSFLYLVKNVSGRITRNQTIDDGRLWTTDVCDRIQLCHLGSGPLRNNLIRDRYNGLKIFLNGPSGTLFCFFLGLFKHQNKFTANKCEKYWSNMWHWDLNSRPLGHESLPLTTRSQLGYHPMIKNFLFFFINSQITTKLWNRKYVSHLATSWRLNKLHRLVQICQGANSLLSPRP